MQLRQVFISFYFWLIFFVFSCLSQFLVCWNCFCFIRVPFPLPFYFSIFVFVCQILLYRHCILGWIFSIFTVAWPQPPWQNCHRWRKWNDRHPLRRFEPKTGPKKMRAIILSYRTIMSHLRKETSSSLYCFGCNDDQDDFPANHWPKNLVINWGKRGHNGRSLEEPKNWAKDTG